MQDSQQNSAHAHVQRGFAFAQLRRYESAASSFQEALSLEPDFVAALTGLCSAQINLRNYYEAEINIHHAISLAPNYPYAFYLLSFLQGYAGAVQAIQEAIRLDPQDPDYHTRLAELYCARQYYSETIDTTNTAIAIDPKHINALMLQGEALLKLERFNEAKEAFRRALEANPEHADAHFELGKLETDSQHPETALQLLTEARRLAPNTNNAPKTIAIAYGRMLRPLTWIDRFIPRFHQWPYIQIWLVFVTLMVCFILYARLNHIQQVDEHRPSVIWQTFCISLMNYFFLNFTYNHFAGAYATFLVRKDVGATSGHVQEQLFTMVFIVFLHTIATGLGAAFSFHLALAMVFFSAVIVHPFIFAVIKKRSRDEEQSIFEILSVLTGVLLFPIGVFSALLLITAKSRLDTLIGLVWSVAFLSFSFFSRKIADYLCRR
jgi:tetratricopeptide (TPR) repeat protein